MSVSRLLSEMDSYELTAWQAYFEVAADEQDKRQRQAQEDAKIERGE